MRTWRRLPARCAPRGCGTLLFTSDDAGRHDAARRPPRHTPTVNFMAGEAPYGNCRACVIFVAWACVVMEWWCGWFDHWGESGAVAKNEREARKRARKMARDVEAMLDAKASVNFYVYEGTNFALNGANLQPNEPYKPTVTSYDYDAPVSRTARRRSCARRWTYRGRGEQGYCGSRATKHRQIYTKAAAGSIRAAPRQELKQLCAAGPGSAAPP